MFKFLKYFSLIFVTVFASLTSCSRQKAIDDYIAIGMPPELAKKGIMMRGSQEVNISEQNNSNPSCP